MAVGYPKWKKVVWRYSRVFLAAFLSQIGINITMFGDADIVRSTIISALAAGLAALAKALREGEKYSSAIHKLPV